MGKALLLYFAQHAKHKIAQVDGRVRNFLGIVLRHRAHEETPENLRFSKLFETVCTSEIMQHVISVTECSSGPTQKFIFELKAIQLHPTIPAHLLVEMYPSRCHYCRMQLYFLAQS